MNGEKSTAISQLLANPHIWRGRPHEHQLPGAQRAAVATGFRVLDACFPGGGWPIGALTEVFAEHQGVGELSLFMPALARMSRSGGADAGRMAEANTNRDRDRDRDKNKAWVVWVAPPFVPYAPALLQSGMDLEKVLFVRAQPDSADDLWALEQVLRSGICSAVLVWLGPCSDRILRRLQTLAEAGACLVIVFRPMSALGSASPAALRLQLSMNESGACVRILKCRGRRTELVQIPGWPMWHDDGARAGDARQNDPGVAGGDAGWR